MSGTSPDLQTTYLGLHLASPFIAGASPLADHLDGARRLEDAGCSAIVLHSLFEEQISEAESGRVHHLDTLDRQFATVVSYFPEPEAFALGPVEYLEHIHRFSLESGENVWRRPHQAAYRSMAVQRRGFQRENKSNYINI